MQLTDIRGHTVATLDLDSNSVGSWSVYDSFGNPQTSQTNTNLINYSSYGQQERAINTTGLILMGARVYNPETNQFTSKDPIKGGNENPYTYPNDSINGSDFSGLLAISEGDINNFSTSLGAVSTVLGIVLCRSFPQICIQSVILFALAVNMSVQYMDMFMGPKSRTGQRSFDYQEWGEAGLTSAISAGVNNALKRHLDKLFGFFLARIVESVVEVLVSSLIRISARIMFSIAETRSRELKPLAPGKNRNLSRKLSRI